MNYLFDHTKHYLFETYKHIIDRCYNNRNKSYKNYGGREIAVCPQWLEDPGDFLYYCDRYLGIRPRGYTIDRINNDGDYEPGNIRFASKETQLRNRRKR